MAYDADTSAYQTIELFGLTEKDSTLPLLEDDELSANFRHGLDRLFAEFAGTGLEEELEPLAHGFASVLHRRKLALGTELDRTSAKIQALVKSADGSEVLETELENAQDRFLKIKDIVGAVETLADTAAQYYEAETGNGFVPASGSRASARAKETGAVFEARQLLEAHDRETAERFKINGVPLIVSGAVDWTDVDTVYRALDTVRERIKQTHAQDIYICHKGAKGAELIAARWAKARQVHQARFDPRWAAHKTAAPFKANDEMLDDKFGAVGVVLFGGGGVALSLGQKAEAKGIKVMRVKATNQE